MSEAIVDHAGEVELVHQQDVPVTNIQKRVDGSFVVTRNGYPFHVTQADTAEVFEQVLAEIKGGAKVSDYVEREIIKPTLAEATTTEYNRLRSFADFTIAPLQDAVDVDQATPGDIERLKAWKSYRVALSRIFDQQSYPDVVWPKVPA
ncbi:tail fiber assembly protein [Pseudomonas sp. FP215]|uniref:tail fiber assembly protein n=1 Tax=Pseudomonas sp. FP215 TaxID=2738126 RepID=UPI0027351A9E|nr:tail fiber assembly protein [Pseudomonas sp. FP215]WLH21588.1 tail fiber assembly protein [Pseudomonas sp. FP215]